MEVAEGIYRLTQGITNFYLIEEAGKFTLVDAGTPGDWDFFCRSIAALGQLPDLEAVLLTHAHPDHTGFAEQARTEAAARVWIPPGRRRGGPHRRHRQERWQPAALSAQEPDLQDDAIPRPPGRHQDDPDQGGGLVRRRGDHRRARAPTCRARARAHPGQRGAVAGAAQRLSTGDVLATKNPLTGRLGPQIMPSGLNEDTPGALRSLGRLDGMHARALLPGHGDPWNRGVAEAVVAAKAAGRS